MYNFIDCEKRPIQCGSPIVFTPDKSETLLIGYPIEFEKTAAGLFRAKVLTAKAQYVIYGRLLPNDVDVEFHNTFLINDTFFNDEKADDIAKKFGPQTISFVDKSPKTPLPDLSDDEIIRTFVERISKLKISMYRTKYNISINTLNGKITLKLYISWDAYNPNRINKKYCTLNIAPKHGYMNIQYNWYIVQAFEKLIDDYLTANP